MSEAVGSFEGIDYILFRIVSGEILQKLNVLKNNLPHGNLWPDYRLNKSILATVPIYRNKLNNLENQKRLLISRPSELIDIKNEVLLKLGIGYPKVKENRRFPDSYKKQLKKFKEFWEGVRVSPYDAIEIQSIHHDGGFMQKVFGRIVFVFTIKSAKLVKIVSSKNYIQPTLPINSELELRIPGDYSEMTGNTVPSAILRPLRDMELTLILSLGISKSDIASINLGDIDIRSISYLSMPGQKLT